MLSLPSFFKWIDWQLFGSVWSASVFSFSKATGSGSDQVAGREGWAGRGWGWGHGRRDAGVALEIDRRRRRRKKNTRSNEWRRPPLAAHNRLWLPAQRLRSDLTVALHFTLDFVSAAADALLIIAIVGWLVLFHERPTTTTAPLLLCLFFFLPYAFPLARAVVRVLEHGPLLGRWRVVYERALIAFWIMKQFLWSLRSSTTPRRNARGANAT